MEAKINMSGKRKKIKATINVFQDTKPNIRKSVYHMKRNIATQGMKKSAKPSIFKGVR